MPKVIEISKEKIIDLQEKLEKGSLDSNDYQLLAKILESYTIINEKLGDKNISIKKLQQMLFGTKTESSKKIINQIEKEIDDEENKGLPDSSAKHLETNASPEKNPNLKRKRHGRLKEDAYKGAERINIKHESLRHKDNCPECGDVGKLYLQKKPGTIVRLIGSPPVTAKVYKLEKLRCSICGKIFTTTPPFKTNISKYYEGSVATSVALLKYGTGMPFHRLEQLQKSLEVPFPKSNAWKVVEEFSIHLKPVYEAMQKYAATGELLYNDDTPVKIFDQVENNIVKEKGGKSHPRKATQTSGIISKIGNKKVALFYSGNSHAGENLSVLLDARPEHLSQPIQMCDALSSNASKKSKTILSNCLAHARHNFTHLFENFPDECRYVITILQKVYRNDKVCKNYSEMDRLIYHKKKNRILMNSLKAYFEKLFQEKVVEENSGLGIAINYMLKRWKRFTLFLEKPGAPLDNNICERALKKTILNRKNSFFYKTNNGAKIGNMFTSIIHTCELNKVNTFKILNAIQENKNDVKMRPKKWFPWNFQNNFV